MGRSITVTALFVLAIGPWFTAPAVLAQTASPPWGIGDVTTADLTPDQVAQALPREIYAYDLDSDATAPGDGSLYEFATESQNFVYSDPSDRVPGGLALNATRLPASWKMADAVRRAAERHDEDPGLKVEAQDLSLAAAVPYVQITQREGSGAAYVLAWGARGGTWLYTLIASGKADREEFVRRLVANLGEDVGGSGSRPETQPPSAGNANQRAALSSDDVVRLLATRSFPTQLLPAGTSFD